MGKGVGRGALLFGPLPGARKPAKGADPCGLTCRIGNKTDRVLPIGNFRSTRRNGMQRHTNPRGSAMTDGERQGNGLQVDRNWSSFVEATSACPEQAFSQMRSGPGLPGLIHELGPKNRALLAETRGHSGPDRCLAYRARGQPHDPDSLSARFLKDIGYLVPEGRISDRDRAMSTPRSQRLPARNWWCRSPMPALR